MKWSTIYRFLSTVALWGGLVISFTKNYDQAAFLIAIAIYLRVLANEEDK